MTLISDALCNVLARKKIELEAETDRVTMLLAECKRDHVNPAKDYWQHQHTLQVQVRLLQQLIEETA